MEQWSRLKRMDIFSVLFHLVALVLYALFVSLALSSNHKHNIAATCPDECERSLHWDFLIIFVLFFSVFFCLYFSLSSQHLLLFHVRFWCFFYFEINNIIHHQKK